MNNEQPRNNNQVASGCSVSNIPQMQWGYKPVMFQTEVQYSKAEREGGEPDWEGFTAEQEEYGSILWVSCHVTRGPIPDDEGSLYDPFDPKDEDTWRLDFAETELCIYVDEDRNIVVQHVVSPGWGGEDAGKQLGVAVFPVNEIIAKAQVGAA